MSVPSHIPFTTKGIRIIILIFGIFENPLMAIFFIYEQDCGTVRVFYAEVTTHFSSQVLYEGILVGGLPVDYNRRYRTFIFRLLRGCLF